MSESTQPPKGFACANCRGVRLFVYRTRRPCAGLVVRYRECSACGARVVTEERIRPAGEVPTKFRATSVRPS